MTTETTDELLIPLTQKTITIPLKFPIEHEGITYETLLMRRPQAGDFIAREKMDGTDDEKDMLLFSLMCSIPYEAMLKVDNDFDLEPIYDARHSFLAKKELASLTDENSNDSASD